MIASSGSRRRSRTKFAIALPFALLFGGVTALGSHLSSAAAEAVLLAAGTQVETDRLGVVGVDTTGVLSPADGALPVDMWRDTPRSLVDALLPRLPVDTPSPAARALMRRLLLSGAAMPRGEAEPGRLLDARAWMLWRMGDTAGVLQLISAAPVDSRSASLWRLDTDARLLAGDAGAACRTAEERIGEDSDIYWQKVLGFCQALAGDEDGAALTIALLSERNEDVRSYRALIDALGIRRAPPPKLVEATPLNLAMLRAAGVSPPPQTAEGEDLALAAMIARTETFAEPLRLTVGERAVAAGVLPAEELYPLFAHVRPSKLMPTASRGGVPTDAPPASVTAVLRESLAADEAGSNQAAWAARVLDAGRQTGAWLQAVHFVAPWLASATPSAETAGAAQTIIPALLVLGERTRAEAWLDWLGDAPGGNPQAEAALRALLPLARLARLRQAQSWNADSLINWWQSERGQSGARLRAERLVTMLQASGENIPDALWQSLLQGPAQVSGTSIDPVFRSQLLRAARARRVGETALLTLVSLGTEGPQSLGMSSLEVVVESLRAVGLEADARALAVEAVSSR